MSDPIKSIRDHRDCSKAIAILYTRKEEGNRMGEKEAIVKYLRGRHLVGFANVLSRKTQENITTWLWQNDLA